MMPSSSNSDVMAETVNPGITAWQAERLIELAVQKKAGDVPRLARKLRSVFEDEGAPRVPISVPERHESALRKVMSGDLSERLLSADG